MSPSVRPVAVTFALVLALAARSARAHEPTAPVALEQVAKGGNSAEDSVLPGAGVHSVVLTVRNPSEGGVRVDLERSTVVIARKADDTRRVDVHATLRAVDVVDPDGAVIAAGATARLRVKVAGLDEPGHFAGVVRLALTPDAGAAATASPAPTLTPVDLELSFVLHHPWWLCALVILAGVMIAYGVGHARDVGRKSLVRRIELGRVRDRLATLAAGGTTTAAVALGRLLLLQAREVGDLIARRDPLLDPEATSPLALLGKRVTLYARYLEVDARIARLPAAIRDAKRGELDAVETVIGNETADVAAITQAGTTLTTIAATGATRAWLATWLGQLEADVASHGAGTDAVLTAAVRTTLAPALRQAQDQARRGDLTELEATLERTQRALIRHGALAIRRAAGQPPAGVEPAEWTQLTTALAGDLEALRVDGAIAPLVRDYGAIRTRYLVAVARGTLSTATVYLARADVTPSRKATVQTAHDTLATVIAAMPIDGAAVDTATAELADLLRLGGVEIVGADEVSPPPAIAPPPVLAAARDLAAPPPPFDEKRLQGALGRTDATVLAVAIVLAVLGGLKALWSSDATWGGTTDIVAALLWGAGVKVSVETFVGLIRLRADLGKV